MHIHAIISALLCHFYNHRHHDRKFFSIVLNCQMHKSIFFHSVSIHHAKYYQICGNCIQSVNQLNRQKFIIMNSTRRWWMDAIVALWRTLFGCVYRRRFHIIAAHYFCSTKKKMKISQICVPFLEKKYLCIFFEVITAD